VCYNNPHGQHLYNQQQEAAPMQQLYYHGTPPNAPRQLAVSNFTPLTPVKHPLTNSSQNNTTTPMQCDHQNKTNQNRHSFRLSSTSEDEQDDINNKIQWQEVRSSKRKRVTRGQETAETKNVVEINNRRNLQSKPRNNEHKTQQTSSYLCIWSNKLSQLDCTDTRTTRR
jgi:hypothetical protein